MKQKLDEELKGAQLLFITSSICSKIFTEAISVITEAGRMQDALAIGFVTVPSEEYSKNPKPETVDMIELSRRLNTVAIIDENKVQTLFPDISLDQITSFSGKLIADMIGGIVD